MKKIITLLLAASLAACVEDTGNYEYLVPDAVSPVILSTLEESYEAISLEQFVIDPEIQGGGDNLEYAWYIYPTLISAAPRDTIGRDRKLDYTVTAKSGTYYLVFKATDKELGTSVYQHSMLSISSVFSQGFYVHKHANGRADIDFIDRNGNKNVDILKQFNGDDLPGKPLRAAFLNGAYRHDVTDAEGNVAGETFSAYILCTDEDMSIYNAENMRLLKSWDEAFFETPAVKKPQGLWASMDGFMLLNDNKLHFTQFNTYGNGRLGYPYPSGDYKYAPWAANGYSGYCLFDETAGTFLGYYPGWSTPLTEVYDYAVGHNYYDYDLLWLKSQILYLYVCNNTFAIIKSRVDNSALIVSVWPHYIQNNLFVVGAEYPLAPGLGLLDGKVFTCHGGNGTSIGHNVIYYSTGDNQVHYYNLANQMTKTSVITLPPDEEIVYLEHAYDYYYEVSFFYVLANKGGEWFLHVYDMEGATPDIKPAVVNTYSGSGTAINAVYRHPNMHMNF
jgi:hypothetical protein